MKIDFDLKEIREQRELSVKAAAKQVGVSEQTWYRWESYPQAQPRGESKKKLISWLTGEFKPLLTDYFKVYVELPSQVSANLMEEYIETAVKCWCGSLHPEDPLFSLNRASVRAIYATGKALV